MKYCPRCGAKLEPGATFCTKCGAKIKNGSSKNDKSASWIKAEQRSEKDQQRTMVFKQQQNQSKRKGQRQAPPPPRREDDDKNKRTNNILTGILIGLLVVAVAVGGFFVWRNRHNNQDGNWRRNQNTTHADRGSNLGGSPEPGTADILTPSASTNESREEAEQNRDSGLVDDNGRTSYMTEGRKNSGFTGIVTDANGKRYLVVNGEVRYGYTGEVTEGDQSYTILNGQVVEGEDETTTTNADDQGVDTTEYNETDNSNGAQKFDDFGYEDDQYINNNPPEMVDGQITYGVDSIAYDDDGNYVVTFVILNGTDKTIDIKEIDNIQLRNGGDEVIATGKIDDLEGGYQIAANNTGTLSTTLINETHENADLSNASLMMDIVQQ